MNGVLNRGVLDNWKSDKWDWSKDFVVITGGSDGIGKHMVLLLAAENIKVVILDIQEPTYDLRTSASSYTQITPKTTPILLTPPSPTANPNIHYHHCEQWW